jgi:polysaccharide deacetylase 2 family uncharacterized protein YibQ
MAKGKKAPAKKGKGGSSSDRNIKIGIVVAILAIALILWGPLKKFRGSNPPAPPPRQQTKAIEPPAPAPKDKKQPAKKQEPVRTAIGPGPALLGGSEMGREKPVRIAIVIDDLGNDVKQAREILDLPASISVAIMPGLSQSKKVAELAKQSNRDILIHIPMAYRGKNGKPAPGMLLADMTPLAFLTTVSDDVLSVPGAIGVNNHEGSALTENKEAMKFLMAELRERKLMFLDSLTSSKSVAYETAKEFGIRTAKRDVFLDNDSNNPASIRAQLEELVEVARRNGKAIGIGHPHPATVSELKSWLAERDKNHLEIVPISRLMQ